MGALTINESTTTKSTALERTAAEDNRGLKYVLLVKSSPKSLLLINSIIFSSHVGFLTLEMYHQMEIIKSI